MRPFTSAQASKGLAREALGAVLCHCPGDKFMLGDEDEELTHMGRSLANGDFEVRCTMIYRTLVELTCASRAHLPACTEKIAERTDMKASSSCCLVALTARTSRSLLAQLCWHTV